MLVSRARGILCLVFSLLLLPQPVSADISAPARHLTIDSLSGTTLQRNAPTTVVLRLSVDGTQLPAGAPVSVSVVSGGARFAEDLATARCIVSADGTISAVLQPRGPNGPVVLQIDAGTAGVSSVRLTQVAAAHRPLVVGFATGGIGAVPGPIEMPDNGPNGWRTRRGAASVYAAGDISRNTRGTFAYDSADSLSQTQISGPYVENPDDRPFPTYGDSSIRRDDALSLNRLFGRIENGRSSALWGEYYASSGSSASAGGFTMLLNGAHVHFEGNNVAVDGFSARNQIAYDRRVLSPTGLGIASQVLRPDIVVGSDSVILAVLDRRTGAILSQQTLIRGSDYVLDYSSGLLRFTNILLPYDAQFNPQIVTVQYEYGGQGTGTNVAGASGRWAISPAAHANAWYLNDAYGSGSFSLLGESVAVASKSASLTASHEHSYGINPASYVYYGNGGDAYDIEASAHSARASIGASYSQTSPGYQNAFGGYSTPGLLSYRAHASLALSKIASLTADYLYAKNDLPAFGSTTNIDNSDSHGSLALRVKPNARFDYHLGVAVDAAASNGTPNLNFFPVDPTLPVGQYATLPPAFPIGIYQPGAGHAIQGDVGATWKFAPHAALTLDHIGNLNAGDIDPYSPPQTSAELAVDVGANGKAYIRQLWQSVPSPTFAASQVDTGYASTAKSQTMIGYDESVGNAVYSSGYSVDHTDTGTDLFDAIGVRDRVQFGKRLSGSVFVQVGQALYASQIPIASPFFVAAGTSLDYGIPSFHATGQVQFRTGYDAGSTMQLGAAGTISPAVTLFGSYTGAFTAGVTDSETRAGLAYRPSRNDRYVTLASVDTVDSNLTNYDAYVSNVAQVQELYRSSTRTEWASSVAYKLTGDDYFAPHTFIFGLRGDQKIGSRWDLGAEGHWSDIAPIASSRATGLAAEVGYRIGGTLRVAGGYTFSGFADPTVAPNPTHRGLYITISSYIDRIFGWGKDEKH